MKKAENVILAGPIGTGKMHQATALGIEAAKQRFRVAFTRAADLVRSLVEARDQRELGRIQRRLSRVDLLIIDEVGFVPFDRTGGELLFNAIAARLRAEERAGHDQPRLLRVAEGLRRRREARVGNCWIGVILTPMSSLKTAQGRPGSK